MKHLNKREKVLIIQSVIPHYRVPVFNELAKYVDLTVMYDSGECPKNVNFSTYNVELKKGLLYVHKINILRYVKQFDVVITMMNYAFLTTWLLAFLCKSTKTILWGIGVSASYNERYDGKEKVVKRLSMFIKQVDAALFYSDYPVSKYVALGLPEKKMFVANNTVQVLKIDEKDRKNILFVGTLYKQKKIFELLDAYFNAYSKNPLVPGLVIVGDGEESESVKTWIKEKGLEQKISMTGGVYEEKELSRYFSEALMCISPDQAGLSVLKSFGYGVPFVTHKDAITGGERLNITNGVTGVLFDSFSQIENIILDCAENNQKYIDMGKCAKEYYIKNRTVEKMVQGFLDAIGYVTR